MDMNISERVIESHRFIAAVLASLSLSLVSACASLPPLDKVRTVSLSTDFSSYSGLVVDVDGNPDTRPGKMAATALEGAGGCGMCIIGAVVIVPVYAATGAVITAVSTLPEEQAHELNRVSADVMAGFSPAAGLSKAMLEEALRQGIVITRRNADARLNIAATEWFWDVSIGNNVAIQIEFEVTGFVDGKGGRRKITYRSERATVPEWLANNGQPIRQTLATIFDEASQEVWQRILDREEEAPT
jgi:hypothetical protein